METVSVKVMSSDNALITYSGRASGCMNVTFSLDGQQIDQDSTTTCGESSSLLSTGTRKLDSGKPPELSQRSSLPAVQFQYLKYCPDQNKIVARLEKPIRFTVDLWNVDCSSIDPPVLQPE